MRGTGLVKVLLIGLAVLGAACLLLPVASAQEEPGEEGVSERSGLGTLGLAIGAGLAVGLTGLATSIAQAGVGSGGTGAMAEKPELFANVLILFAIPETIVILGFVIAFLIVNNI